MLEDFLQNEVNKSMIKEKQELFEKMLVIPSKRKVNDALKYFNAFERNLLYLYYGLDGENLLTTKQIGQKFGINEQFVEIEVSKLVERINDYIINKSKKR